MKTTWAATSAMALMVALTGGASAAPPAKPPAAGAKPTKPPAGVIVGEKVPGADTSRPGSRLDVVFAIDTTGSMGGIIDDGKAEIRKIVDEILGGDPKPDLRVGMVVYRDRGDSYLVKHIPLSRDFEAFYKFMARHDADEGGDWPEHVNYAMHVGISKFNWDLDKNVARMMFLIGDAPAHMDYDDLGKYDYRKEAAIAKSKSIVINTLAMNSDPEVTAQWTEIAKITGGSYKMIGYGGEAAGTGPGIDSGKDGYEERDFTGAPGDSPSAPKSSLGKSVSEAVKAAATKKGTKYDKAPAPKPAPKAPKTAPK